MIHQGGRALDPRIGQLAYLLAIELIPFLGIELLKEVADELGMDEVDKGIPHVAGVVVVQGQVHKIKLQLMISIDFLQQHLFCILVRDVTDHNRGSSIVLYLYIGWQSIKIILCPGLSCNLRTLLHRWSF